MKRILLVAVLASTFAFAGCTKSKEDKCKAAMEHVMEITLGSPQMKAMMKDPKMAKEMKKKMKEGIDKGVKRCVKEFDEDSYQCIMKAKKATDMMKCKPKKK